MRQLYLFFRTRLVVITLGLGCVFVLSGHLQAASLQVQRDWYGKAQDALDREDLAEFEKLRKGLGSYSLTPYLDYRRFLIGLDSRSPEAVAAFVARHQDLPFVQTLRRRYVEELADHSKWHMLLKFQKEAPDSEALQCRYHFAQFKVGQSDAAWQGARALWRSGNSVDGACDPLFSAWDKAGVQSDTDILDRMLLVFQAGNGKLLKYLYKQLSPSGQVLGKEMVTLFYKPERVAWFSKKSKISDFHRELVHAAFFRLAQEDPKEAVTQLARAAKGQRMETAERQTLAEAVAGRLMDTDSAPLVRWRDKVLAKSKDVDLLVRRARMAISAGDWLEVEAWIGRLPGDVRAEPRWQYWLARVEIARGLRKSGEARLSQILGQRDFYSVAAAEYLGESVQFSGEKANGAKVTDPRDQAVLARIEEMFALGKVTAARVEWESLLARSSRAHAIALAAYAHTHDWHYLAVRATIVGELWEHLSLRFPVAYQKWFSQYGGQNKIDAPTLMALARQESALNPLATSRVGARGLMQLMPATARETARAQGVLYAGKRSLHLPQINIRLGTGYLRTVLDRFADNRVLAFAAYNAGPHRVDRWLQESGGKRDVYAFIESIPFRETRRYVKNVLMFEMYYRDLLGKPMTLLRAHERKYPY